MKARTLALTALFAALTAVGAFLRIPFFYSAITLQFFFTALSGVLLGAKYGAASQAVYVALGLAGLPVFASGGGPSYLLQPTCGFLFGLIPAAWVTGRIAGGGRSARRVLPACLAGLAALYAVGLPYLAAVVNLYLGGSLSARAVFLTYLLPCLPGDAVKIAAVVSLAPKLLPRIRSAASAPPD